MVYKRCYIKHCGYYQNRYYNIKRFVVMLLELKRGNFVQ